MNDDQTKYKMCTMNCGPAAGDMRTRAERMSVCGDCIEVNAPAQSDTEVLNAHIEALEQQVSALQQTVHHWKSNHDHMVLKAAFLSERPDLPVDRIPAYRELERLRAQLDGRPDVSDIDVGDMLENDAGIGLDPKSDAFKSGMPAKLTALSKHMESIAVEMDYFGGFAPWARCGGELMGAAMLVAEWADACVASEKDQP